MSKVSKDLATLHHSGTAGQMADPQLAAYDAIAMNCRQNGYERWIGTGERRHPGNDCFKRQYPEVGEHEHFGSATSGIKMVPLDKHEIIRKALLTTSPGDEMVMNFPRKMTWEDDPIHVKDRFAAQVTGSFIRRWLD